MPEMEKLADTLPNSETLEATISLMPFLGGTEMDERKAKYLAYRYVGFSFNEAVELTGITAITVLRWRSPDRRVGGRQKGTQYDAEFATLESNVTTENRTRIRREVLQNLFTRNMVLILEYDYQIIRRVKGLEVTQVTDETGHKEAMVVLPSKQDLNYLNRMRGNYGPQQLMAMEKLAETGPEEGFSITQLILNMNLNRPNLPSQHQPERIVLDAEDEEPPSDTPEAGE